MNDGLPGPRANFSFLGSAVSSSFLLLFSFFVLLSFLLEKEDEMDG